MENMCFLPRKKKKDNSYVTNTVAYRNKSIATTAH